MRKVSVVLPSRGRAAQARRCVERLLATTRGYALEVVVVTDGCRETSEALRPLADRLVELPRRSGAPAAWNAGAAAATGEIIVLGADDLWWGHGWIGEMLERMAELPDGDGLVGFNDLARDGDELATHYAISRRFMVEHLGGVLACPAYRHYYIDNEANVRAKLAGRFTWARFCLVEHRHPLYGKAEMDTVYAETMGLIEQDGETFLRRAAAGFPDDYKPSVSLEGRFV